MDSIASRRNRSPFRTSNSYAASRTVDNSPLRQSSTVASGISLNTAVFSSQNTRKGLSRSYDSPEGIRRMSQVPAKKASSSFYRAASPPSCASSSKQHSSASGRNQTILDDAAWMSERLLNLQRTGFLRYPSISKLLEPGNLVFSHHLSSASIPDDVKKSYCFSPHLAASIKAHLSYLAREA